MKLEITRLEGLRNDLVIRLERAEIERALLSIPHRDALMALPGIPWHRASTGSVSRSTRFSCARSHGPAVGPPTR